MLDSDLAQLYEVPTKQLNRAVQGNIGRFPPDFMFQLHDNEEEFLRCQIGTSSLHGGKRYGTRAFTQEGIAIMRTFVQLREMLSSNAVLAAKLEELEQKVGSHDQAIVGIFKMLQGLMNPPRVNAIGFTADLGKKS
jgi:hypothetical protein